MNMARLYMQGLCRVLNLFHRPQQCLNIPQYVSILLYMDEHGWISLNVPEYTWIKTVLTIPEFSVCLIILYFDRVLDVQDALNMLGFWIYCDVLIITLLLYELMLLLLEFVSAWFVDPGAQQLAIFSFFNKSYNIRITKLLINFSFWLQWRQRFRSI